MVSITSGATSAHHKEYRLCCRIPACMTVYLPPPPEVCAVPPLIMCITSLIAANYTSLFQILFTFM